MSYEFKNDTPIYLQIIEQIKLEIITKKYLPNDKLPSVREFSMQLEVNPNTVQKALTELESIGLIYTERTNGKFVTGDKEIIERTKRDMISVLVKNFYKSMENIGINKKEAVKILTDGDKNEDIRD